MRWLIFENEKGTRVTITQEITNFKEEKAWQNRINRTKHSKKIAYIGDGKEDE